MEEGIVTEKALGEELQGKYLTFKLGVEEYALAILKVQEIIRMQPITRVPKSPFYIKGVINLRGKVIPIVSLSLKFDMPEPEETALTCIVVVQVERNDHEVIMGVVIDSVSEVLDIQGEAIEATPDFGSTIDTEFIQGIGKIGEHVKMILDIDRVLSLNELETVSQLA